MGGGPNVLAIYVTFHLYLHLYLHTMMNAVSSVADYLLIFTMFCEGQFYLHPMFYGARTFYVLCCSVHVHVFIQTMMNAGPVLLTPCVCYDILYLYMYLYRQWCMLGPVLLTLCVTSTTGGGARSPSTRWTLDSNTDSSTPSPSSWRAKKTVRKDLQTPTLINEKQRTIYDMS